MTTCFRNAPESVLYRGYRPGPLSRASGDCESEHSVTPHCPFQLVRRTCEKQAKKKNLPPKIMQNTVACHATKKARRGRTYSAPVHGVCLLTGCPAKLLVNLTTSRHPVAKQVRECRARWLYVECTSHVSSTGRLLPAPEFRKCSYYVVISAAVYRRRLLVTSRHVATRPSGGCLATYRPIEQEAMTGARFVFKKRDLESLLPLQTLSSKWLPASDHFRPLGTRVNRIVWEMRIKRNMSNGRLLIVSKINDWNLQKKIRLESYLNYLATYNKLHSCTA